MVILHIDTFDYRMYREENPWDSETFFSNLSETIQDTNGGSVLIHDLPATAEMLPEIIEMFKNYHKDNDMEFVSLEYLLHLKYSSSLYAQKDSAL